MSSILSRSTSTASLSVSASPITTAQEAAQAKITAASQQLKSANEEVKAQQSAVDQAENDVQKYASKGPKDPKYQEAVAVRNTAYQNLEMAKQKVAKAQGELATAKDALPAAQQADKQATDTMKAREEATRDRAETQTRDAQESKEASDKSKVEQQDTTKPQQQTQSKGKAPSAASLVGAAAGGGAAETEGAAVPKKTADSGGVPRAEGDGYAASSPKPNADKRFGNQNAGGSPSALTDEETLGAGHAQSRNFAAAGKPAAAGAPAPQSGAQTGASSGTTPSVAAGTDANADVVTDSGIHYSELPQSMKDLIDKTKKEAMAAAREGDVKRTEQAFKDGFAAIGNESGVAETEDTTGRTSGKGDKKKSTKNAGVGAAAGGKSKVTVGATGGAAGGGASATTLTAAGNGAASAATGATGATTAATDRPAIQQLAAAQAGKPMVGVNLQGSGKAATGKSSSVGASGDTIGATGSDSGSAYDPIVVGANTEIGKAYSGGMSPMELVQMVMLKAFQEAGEDVRNAAEMMQKQTDAKQTARMGQNGLRDLVSYDDRGVLSSVTTGTNSISAKDASNMLQSIDGNIDAIGDDNQILMIRLQNLTQLMTTMSQAASNMSKSQFDTTKSVIGQIGH